MKIWIKGLIFFTLAIVVLYGCYPPPEFPVEPSISFENIIFKKGGDEGDSLLLYVNFQDGDGNIGLEGSESGPPFHLFNYIEDSKGERVTLNGTGYTLPFILVTPIGGDAKEKEEFSTSDNRPPFNCQDYEVQTNVETGATDTFFISKNKFNNNIFVDFYRKRNGVYEFFDWSKVASTNRCGPDWNGRVPVFDHQNFENKKPLAGTIEYAMVSVGFELAMRNDTFKIEIQLVDHELNESNIIETRDFTLEEILE